MDNNKNETQIKKKPKSKKCSHYKCNKKINLISFDCKYCEKKFCNNCNSYSVDLRWT